MPRYTNCIVPDGGYPTQDGYIRVLTKLRRLGGLLKMRHRLEWEKVHGTIQEGYEIDHMCKNRACCNIKHLQCLSKSAHKSKDNSERYRERGNLIRQYKLDNPTALHREIGKIFGVHPQTIGNNLRGEVNI